MSNMPHHASASHNPGVHHLGQQTAEAIRQLNHHTSHHDAFTGPAELDALLADLAVTAHRLPQLLDQLGAWLDREHHQGLLRTDNQTSPAELVTLTGGQLTAAKRTACQLAAALDTAHQHTAHLATA